LRYSVEITDAALADAEEYVLFIRRQSNDELAAVSWWNGLLEAVDSLESLPSRCPRIPEAEHFAGKLHHLIYASHRIIFEVEPGRVTVLRIYHGARKPLKTPRVRGKSSSAKGG
jgi:plasmid stabilization system protein ParE